MPNGFMHTLLWHIMKCECAINTDKNMIEGIRSEPVELGMVLLYSHIIMSTQIFLLDCIMILFDKSAETHLTDLDLI